MTITAPAAAALAAPILPAVEAPLCEHLGCLSGEPAELGPMFPGPDGQDLGGPRRPAGWGGYGPGEADPAATCPNGYEACCGRCGCREEQ